jgi:Predicted transcriptional regulators
MSLSQNLRQRRLAMGLTISHLSRLTNVSRSYLSQIESNEDASPSADFLYRIAFALQTSIPELLGKDSVDNEMPDVNDALRDFALQESLGSDDASRDTL